MRKVILLLVLVNVAVAAYFLSQPGMPLSRLFSEHDSVAAPSASEGAGTRITGNPLEMRSPYRTEEHWMVSEICDDIAKMIDVGAANGKLSTADTKSAIEVECTGAGGAYRIRASQSAAPFELAIKSFIWAPSTYEEWAQFYAAQKGVALRSTSQDSAEFAVGALLDLRARTLQRQNMKISSWLTEKPLEPSAHEGAALLLAAFALREASGTFYDTRHTLNRLTAHLAVARALRQGEELQEAGALADIALRVLAGRQREATGLIDSWRHTSPVAPATESWLNALALRAGGDWQNTEATAKNSLLEKLECFRALARHVRSAAAIRLLEESGTGAVDIVPDWSRIVLASGYTVEEGHWCSRQGIPLELEEIEAVYKLGTGRELDDANLPQALNASPGGAVGGGADGRVAITVIDQGAWGREAQRHLCHQAARMDSFLRDMYGSASTADQYAQSIDPYLKELLYFPVVQRFRAQDQGTYDRALEGSGRMIQAHPEWVSEQNWIWLRSAHVKFRYQQVVPYIERWILPPMPAGTVYNSAARVWLPQVREGPPTELDRWREIAPLDEQLSLRYARRKYADNFTAEQLREIVGPPTDYDLEIMTWLSKKLQDRPDEYEHVLQKMCQLDADKWFYLAHYYVQHQMDEKAAEAYQRGFDLGDDRVNASNLSGWLVNYYFEHGKVEQAVEIARQSAAVGSGLGLTTALELSERMGRLDDAERFGEQIRGRYDDSGALFGFYWRQVEKTGADTYRTKLDNLVREAFGKGIEKVTLSSFSAPPTDGVLFPSGNEKTRQAGLTPGFIVVALDGYRVHNEKQYSMINAMKLRDEVLHLILWQDGRYQEITTAQSNRKFGVEIRDYSPGR